MDKQTLRFILLAAVLFSGYLLFVKQDPAPTNLDPEITAEVPEAKEQTAAVVPVAVKGFEDTTLATVATDVFNLKINNNGDIVFAELTQYPNKVNDYAGGFNLLEQSEQKFYVAQTGLLSEFGPDSSQQGRAKFTTKQAKYVLGTENELVVDLLFTPASGPLKNLQFIKRFRFYKNKYLINIEYLVSNDSNADYRASLYGRLRRQPEQAKRGWFAGGLRTYTGSAISTPNEKYKKMSFADMKKNYKIAFSGGWVAMLEHYFVSAFIPDANLLSEYQTEEFKDGSLGIRFINSAITVSPGSTKVFKANLFLGPKKAELLKQVAPALDLTVDYGILWWLSVPLFWLLKHIYSFVGNWGWAIIITTLLVKLLFYKLSAVSYKSMSKLRTIQPKIEALKQRCGDDKQKFSQEMMGLYRDEKVNPLGGCLPLLVQIPVFIALYYVLLESVELRQASWMLWVQDLSAKDPFYVLPLLMGGSMFLQQKLNPPPADPTQAKVLMFMPIFFTALFLQFPAGLMLYWFVNNTLSILQQLFIEKMHVAKK